MNIRVKSFSEIGADKNLEKIAKSQFFPTHIFGEVGNSIDTEPVMGDWNITIYNEQLCSFQEWWIPVELCEVII